MKIPFDIKYRPQIESGEYKVVTRDGSPVRIICWDRKSAGDGQPIVALVENGHYEKSIWVEENGVYKGTMGHEYDLFIITPEPEFTELEKAIKRGMLCAGLQGVSTAIIKETAKEVKDIICKGCTVSIDSYIKGRDDERKEHEKPITYHFPMYEPPCFHGGICINPFKDCINCPRTGGDIGISTTSGTCKKD